MSVSLTEVLKASGYDPAENVLDASWFFSQYDDFDELANKAQELLDKWDEYQDVCSIQEDMGGIVPKWEDWRKNETAK